MKIFRFHYYSRKWRPLVARHSLNGVFSRYVGRVRASSSARIPYRLLGPGTTGERHLKLAILGSELFLPLQSLARPICSGLAMNARPGACSTSTSTTMPKRSCVCAETWMAFCLMVAQVPLLHCLRKQHRSVVAHRPPIVIRSSSAGERVSTLIFRLRWTVQPSW